MRSRLLGVLALMALSAAACSDSDPTPPVDKECPSGTHDDGTGKCVAQGCAIGYHDDGAGKCVAQGCAIGYHDGGDGSCLPKGQCIANYMRDRDGRCIKECAEGYHDGGDKVCMPDGQCSDGYHDGGKGTCMALDKCDEGYWLGGNPKTMKCLPIGECSDGYRSNGKACTDQPGCADGFHDGGDDNCLPRGECSPGFVDGGNGECLPDGNCATGYHFDGESKCVPNSQGCASGYHFGALEKGKPQTNFLCVPEDECAEGYHDNGRGLCWKGTDCDSPNYKWDAASQKCVCESNYHHGGRTACYAKDGAANGCEEGFHYGDVAGSKCVPIGTCYTGFTLSERYMELVNNPACIASCPGGKHPSCSVDGSTPYCLTDEYDSCGVNCHAGVPSDVEPTELALGVAENQCEYSEDCACKVWGTYVYDDEGNPIKGADCLYHYPLSNGLCVQSCPVGQHEGGSDENSTPKCLPEGECSPGYHDGGEGECVPTRLCSPGFLRMPTCCTQAQVDAGECASSKLCAEEIDPWEGAACIASCGGTGFTKPMHDDGQGNCTFQGLCADSHHLGSLAADAPCVAKKTCLPGFALLLPDETCAIDCSGAECTNEDCASAGNAMSPAKALTYGGKYRVDETDETMACTASLCVGTACAPSSCVANWFVEMTGTGAEATGECVQRCDPKKLLYGTNTCVDACPDEFIDGGDHACVRQPTEPGEHSCSTFYVFNTTHGLCLADSANCTGGTHNGGGSTGTCLTTGCANHYYMHPTYEACVYCPAYIDGDACVESCPGGKHDGGDRLCRADMSCNVGWELYPDPDFGPDCVVDCGAKFRYGESCVDACPSMLHDGGDKVCLPKGECSQGYELSGEDCEES